MISNPKPGQVVQVWYGRGWRRLPLHGRQGVVRIAGNGKPRNHGVEIGGQMYVVNGGHLRNPR